MFLDCVSSMEVLSQCILMTDTVPQNPLSLLKLSPGYLPFCFLQAGAGQESIDRHQSLHVQHRCGEEEELREGFESEAMAKPRTLAWASGFRRSMHLGSWLATLAAKNETLQPLAVSLVTGILANFCKFIAISHLLEMGVIFHLIGM